MELAGERKRDFNAGMPLEFNESLSSAISFYVSENLISGYATQFISVIRNGDRNSKEKD
jgi:hypothetical protein